MQNSNIKRHSYQIIRIIQCVWSLHINSERLYFLHKTKEPQINIKIQRNSLIQIKITDKHNLGCLNSQFVKCSRKNLWTSACFHYFVKRVHKVKYAYQQKKEQLAKNPTKTQQTLMMMKHSKVSGSTWQVLQHKMV